MWFIHQNFIQSMSQFAVDAESRQRSRKSFDIAKVFATKLSAYVAIDLRESNLKTIIVMTFLVKIFEQTWSMLKVRWSEDAKIIVKQSKNHFVVWTFANIWNF